LAIRSATPPGPRRRSYPSDLGLLARAVGKLAATITGVKAAGGATRTRVRDRRRAARRAHEVARLLRARTGDAKQVAFQVTAQVAGLAEHAVADAARVVRNANQTMRRADRSWGRLGRAVRELETTITRTQQLLGQARQPWPARCPRGPAGWSVCTTPDARPIRKGRIARPVEFGYKAQVLDNPDGIVVDHQVQIGNPPDAPQLVPAIKRVIQHTSRVPGAVAADPGYGQASVDDELAALGVQQVAIPRRDKTSGARRQVEHARPFRRLVKWRTGSQGRIW
jgi:transposase, IS5 family